VFIKKNKLAIRLIENDVDIVRCKLVLVSHIEIYLDRGMAMVD